MSCEFKELPGYIKKNWSHTVTTVILGGYILKTLKRKAFIPFVQ
jgi:hypothetical protein